MRTELADLLSAPLRSRPGLLTELGHNSNSRYISASLGELSYSFEELATTTESSDQLS